MANLALSKTFKVAAIGAISTLYLGTSAWALPQTADNEIPATTPSSEAVQNSVDEAPAAPKLTTPDEMDIELSGGDSDVKASEVAPEAPNVELDSMDDVAAPDATPAPADMVETKPALGQPGMLEDDMSEPVMEKSLATPAVSKITLPANYECYEQDNGNTECMCQTEASCDALTEADVCMDGSNWTSDTISGCTQKE